jgi:hypothetical protein
MSDTTCEFIALLGFAFLLFSVVMVWSYVTDKMKLEAIKMAKELAEKAAELEKSQNTTEEGE